MPSKKKIGKQATINKNPTPKKGRLILCERLNDPLRFPLSPDQLRAQITDSDNTPGNAVISKDASITITIQPGPRLLLTFTVLSSFNLLDLHGSSGLTDGFLSVTLTNIAGSVGISSASTDTTGTATISTGTTAHGFSQGQIVTVAISGLTVPAYNGNFTILTVSDAFTFTYRPTSGAISTAMTLGTSGTVAPASNGPIGISSAGEANSTTSIVTISTGSIAHGFTVNQAVAITGLNTPAYNGTFPILTVPTLTSFTYQTNPPASGLGTDSSTSGTATPAGNIPVQQDVPFDYIDDPLSE